MKKIKVILPITFVFLIILGCLGNPSSNTSVSKEETLEEDDELPDIYIKNYYKSISNVTNGVVLSAPTWTDEDNLPKRVCKNGEEIYVLINDSVYCIKDGDKKLIFDGDSTIVSLEYATDDYIIYLCEHPKISDNGEANNAVWKYDLNTGSSNQVFQSSMTTRYFRLMYLEDYLFDEKWPNLYIADFISDKQYIINDFEEMDDDLAQSHLPDGFEISEKTYQGHQYREILKDGEPIEKYDRYEDNEYVGYSSYSNSLAEGYFQYSIYYNQNIYCSFSCGKLEEQGFGYHGPRIYYGTSEKMKSEQWAMDYISVRKSGELSENRDEYYYTDSENRIIGFNPEENEVYLYVYKDGTLCAKNLDDQSITVLETLENAQIIQFEWIDTNLYWIYINDGNEEYGGCHTFDDSLIDEIEETSTDEIEETVD